MSRLNICYDVATSHVQGCLLETTRGACRARATSTVGRHISSRASVLCPTKTWNMGKSYLANCSPQIPSHFPHLVLVRVLKKQIANRAKLSFSVGFGCWYVPSPSHPANAPRPTEHEGSAYYSRCVCIGGQELSLCLEISLDSALTGALGNPGAKYLTFRLVFGYYVKQHCSTWLDVRSPPQLCTYSCVPEVS